MALFQHHDAITGTAKQFVTHDYGEKMFDGMIATRNLMKVSSQYMLMKVKNWKFICKIKIGTPNLEI